MFMMHTIFFQQGFKFLLNEVGTIITDEDTRDSGMGEDDLFEKPSNYWGVIVGLARASTLPPIWTHNEQRP